MPSRVSSLMSLLYGTFLQYSKLLVRWLLILMLECVELLLVLLLVFLAYTSIFLIRKGIDRRLEGAFRQL